MKYTVRSNENAAQMLFDKASQFTAEAIVYGEDAAIAANRGRCALADLLGVDRISFDMDERGGLSATLEMDD